MARIEDMSDFNDGINNYKFFFINETSVGKGGQNQKKTDIQLIQFFLKQFFRINSQLKGRLPPTKSGKSDFQIDGKYGRQTEVGIRIFQEWCQKQGKPIKPDGLVSVPVGKLTSTSGNIYTILLLNSWYNKYWDDGDGRDDITFTFDLVAYAPELLQELTRKKPTNEI